MPDGTPLSLPVIFLGEPPFPAAAGWRIWLEPEAGRAAGSTVAFGDGIIIKMEVQSTESESTELIPWLPGGADAPVYVGITGIGAGRAFLVTLENRSDHSLWPVNDAQKALVSAGHGLPDGTVVALIVERDPPEPCLAEPRVPAQGGETDVPVSATGPGILARFNLALATNPVGPAFGGGDDAGSAAVATPPEGLSAIGLSGDPEPLTAEYPRPVIAASVEAVPDVPGEPAQVAVVIPTVVLLTLEAEVFSVELTWSEPDGPQSQSAEVALTERVLQILDEVADGRQGVRILEFWPVFETFPTERATDLQLAIPDLGVTLRVPEQRVTNRTEAPRVFVFDERFERWRVAVGIEGGDGTANGGDVPVTVTIVDRTPTPTPAPRPTEAPARRVFHAALPNDFVLTVDADPPMAELVFEPRITLYENREAPVLAQLYLGDCWPRIGFEGASGVFTAALDPGRELYALDAQEPMPAALNALEVLLNETLLIMAGEAQGRSGRDRDDPDRSGPDRRQPAPLRH